MTDTTVEKLTDTLIPDHPQHVWMTKCLEFTREMWEFFKANPELAQSTLGNGRAFFIRGYPYYLVQNTLFAIYKARDEIDTVDIPNYFLHRPGAVRGGKVYLQGIGRVRLKDTVSRPERIMSARIRYDGEDWVIEYTVELCTQCGYACKHKTIKAWTCPECGCHNDRRRTKK